MRLELREDGLVLVVLSRRNVLSLLSKLEQRHSARTIAQRGAYVYGVLHEDLYLAVQVEPDELHYADRCPPGAMSPETEAFIASRTPPNGAPGEKGAGEEVASMSRPPRNDLQQESLTLLEHALDLLSSSGWARGAYARDRHRHPVRPTSPRAVRY